MPAGISWRPKAAPAAMGFGGPAVERRWIGHVDPQYIGGVAGPTLSIRFHVKHNFSRRIAARHDAAPSAVGMATSPTNRAPTPPKVRNHPRRGERRPTLRKPLDTACRRCIGSRTRRPNFPVRRNAADRKAGFQTSRRPTRRSATMLRLPAGHTRQAAFWRRRVRDCQLARDRRSTAAKRRPDPARTTLRGLSMGSLATFSSILTALARAICAGLHYSIAPLYMAKARHGSRFGRGSALTLKEELGKAATIRHGRPSRRHITGPRQ
jgi:hypothetical protein